MREASRAPSRTYEPVLDGLRAISILFVVVRHLEITKLVSANLGVTIFFFISGFIITRLMLVEVDQNGKVDMPRFWGRRFVRLVPALYLMIVAVVAYALLMRLTIDWWQVLAGLLYYMNYYSIHIRDAGGDYTLPLNPLWSLAVEEHYYIIYPFIFMSFFKNPGKFIGIISAAIVISLVWRIININLLGFTPKYNYFATESRIDTILFGCLLAYMASLAAKGSRGANRILSLCGRVWIVLPATVLLFGSLFMPGELFANTFRYTSQSILLFIIIAGILFGPAMGILRSLLAMAPLTYIGRISYSLYLWHLPVVLFVEGLVPVHVRAFPWIALAGSFAVASFSFHIIEKPVIRRFAPRLRASQAG